MTRAAVIGLGTMGPGIAQTLARTGMRVTAYDPFPQARETAPASLALASTALTNLGVEQRGSDEVAITDDLAVCVEGADLVVETVPEKLEIKAEVLQALDQ